MDVPNKLLEQIALNTRHKIEEHMLIVMVKSTHEEHLLQQLQTNNKHFKIALTFLTGYNDIFIVTNSNNKFYFRVSINDDVFSVIFIPPRAYELESLNNEIKGILIKDSYFTEENYPFIIRPNFSTLCSIIEINPNFIGTQLNIVHNDSISYSLGFHSVVVYEKDNLSQNPVDILSFDNTFIESDIASV